LTSAEIGMDSRRALLGRPVPRAAVFEASVLAVHVAAALILRTVAWPEVTTPAYLWSRGFVLYRDVKYLHTPGLIGLLALCFGTFGPATWVVRAFALSGPLVAHAQVLTQTRTLSVPRRSLVAGFFLVCLFVSNGNAVWPAALMAPLALPIAHSLAQERWRRAGLAIGTAILLKQTAAYVLIAAALVLLVRRRGKAIAELAFFAALPYAVALGAFAIAGAGGEMLRWTLLVPFQVQEIAFRPGLFTVVMLAAEFVPLLIVLAREARAGRTEALWLLVVALGLTFLSYPNFLLMQTVAAIPCLAVGAARSLAPGTGRRAAALAAFLFVYTVSRGIVLSAGETFDGRVLFWNDDPDFNAVIEKLRRLPAGTRVHSELWGNVLPRADRLPPDKIWVHPWLRWYFEVENCRARVLAAARVPGTVWVGYRGALPAGERVGPYAIWRVPDSHPTPLDNQNR
jgi:hypothetical protein